MNFEDMLINEKQNHEMIIKYKRTKVQIQTQFILSRAVSISCHTKFVTIIRYIRDVIRQCVTNKNRCSTCVDLSHSERKL